MKDLIKMLKCLLKSALSNDSLVDPVLEGLHNSYDSFLDDELRGHDPVISEHRGRDPLFVAVTQLFLFF